MMSIRIATATLACWAGISYVLCIAWCGVAPEGWHAREFLELALPGFRWLSPATFLLGLLESVGIGAYSGALLAFLHNRMSKALSHDVNAARVA